VLIVCLTGATVAQAILPTDSRDGEIPVPQGIVAPTYRQLDAQESSRVLPGWDVFSGSRGNGWMVIQYRDDLQTPATLIGPGIPVTATGASEVEITQAVRDFVTTYAGMLKADPAGLGPARVTPLDATRTQFILPQIYRDLAVVGGRIEVYLDEGKAVMMGSHYFPGIDVGVNPVLSAERAQAAAIAGVNFSAATDAFEGQPRLVVYPMVLDGAASYFLAWELKFSTASPVGYWWAYVDATDGDVLVRTNHAAALEIPTTVKSNVQLNYPNDPQTEVLSPDHFVQLPDSIYYTDADGFVNLSVPTADPYLVESWIRGKYCITGVYEAQNGYWSGNGTSGTPLLVKWDNTNSLLSERDAYYSVNRIHKWLKDHDPTFTGLDHAVATIVNRTDGTCNAYWNGDSINFYKEGGGCVNMATMSDVVMHEYGHAITQYTYAPDPSPTASGMGEGLSDIVSQTITNDRYVGRYIYGGGGYIRDGMNTVQWPGASCSGQVHCLGEILMGSMWKTRTNVINKMGAGPGLAHYDAMVRFAWKAKQTTMPDYLTKVLLADDNNANIADGTPNWDQICDAFAIHNLSCPAITQYVWFSHTPIVDNSNTTTPISITALVQPLGCGDLVADSTRVYYSTDIGATWSSILMEPTGNPTEFSADLPVQPCGAVVRYYLRAATTTGVTGTLPARAPQKDFYQFMVGPRVAVHNATFETDLGWTVGAPGDGATDGLWERVDPVGKANAGVIYQPEDDHTASGTLCYVTNGLGGYYLDHDVDGGATTLLSPIFDLSTTSGACKLDFWAFFMNTIAVDDTLRASVSNDGGTTWFDVWKIYGQGLNAWTNYKAYFTSTQVPFTNQMRVRFQIADYNSSQTEGAIDDLVIRRTTCAPSVYGACCAPAGTCTVTTSALCTAPSAWQGAGTNCSPNLCVPTAACCALEGTCTLTTEVGCVSPSVWQGAGTNCSPNLCVPTAACCALEGTCTLTTEVGCVSPSLWQGAGTSCSPNLCVPRAACCAPDGACTVTTEAGCVLPSLWQIPGTTCESSPCPSDVPQALVPVRFAVEAARPNPTSTGSTIRFALPAAGEVGIDLFDAGGRLARTLAQGPMVAGYHSVTWDGNDASGSAVASGVYYYRVRANGQAQTRRVLVVR
jgi:hypothetical protein